MAEEILRSKHAFGDSVNLDQAISDGLVDKYDILFLDGLTNPKIGWIDKNGNKIIIEQKTEVLYVSALPSVGKKNTLYVCEDQLSYWNGSEFISLQNKTGLTEEEVNEKISIAVSDVNQYVDNKVIELNEAINSIDSNAKAYTDEKVAELNESISNVNESISNINETISNVNESISNIGEDIDSILNESKIYVDEQIKKCLDTFVNRKYDVSNTPIGTLVDYREKEIRVMCPSNTVWTTQDIGKDVNLYYMMFKAYAPENAVSFKKGDQGVIIDQILDFNSSEVGIDELGKYNVCWLPIASYDESTDMWTYYGKNSTEEEYFGWTYIVEWYDSEGIVIESDKIRINLTNEDCHLNIEPYYVLAVINNKVTEKVEEAVTEAASKAATEAIAESNSYTDSKIAEIIDSYEIKEF